jgi:DNA-directed RNA polymerase specialized sigma24 family protein
MFPTTRWSLVRAAGEGDETARRQALETLLAAYWRPVYAFVRRRGLAPEAAEDAVQAPVLHLLEHDALRRVDPGRGRFRSWLLTAVQHDLIKLHERDTAQKRGGGVTVVALDALDGERDLPALPDDPGRAFDRAWALGLEYHDGRRKGSAETVLRFFSLDATPTYAEAAAACGMSAVQFKAALHRARERYRALLREEVADTVDSPQEVDGELRALFDALRA